MKRRDFLISAAAASAGSFFSTRIAFVSKLGNRYRLNIADWDGENVVTPLNSPEPVRASAVLPGNSAPTFWSAPAPC